MVDRREKKAGSVKLDLGLTELLREPDKFPPREQVESEPPPVSPVREPDPIGPLNDFEKLAAESRWAELTRLCEVRIPAAGADQNEARVWWALSQFRQESLPLGMLSAPLDTATHILVEAMESAAPGVDEKKRLSALVSGLLVEFAGKLGHAGDRSMAITLLERAYRLNSSGRNLLCEFLRAEVKELESDLRIKRDQGLQEQCARMRTLLLSLGAEPESAASGATKDVPEKRQSHDPQMFLLLSLLLATALAAWYFLPHYFTGEAGRGLTAGHAEFDFEAPARSAALRVPVVSLRSGPGSLEALNYELDSKQPRAKQTESVPTVVESPVAAAGAASITEVPAAQAEAQKTSLPEKEAVDTSSPVRPADFPSSVAVSGKGTAGNEARYPGASVGGAPASRALEVETFTEEREYRVRFRSQVMSKPSDFSSLVHELKAGDLVRADARVGLWLRLRSREGRPGYVREADVEDLR